MGRGEEEEKEEGQKPTPVPYQWRPPLTSIPLPLLPTQDAPLPTTATES